MCVFYHAVMKFLELLLNLLFPLQSRQQIVHTATQEKLRAHLSLGSLILNGTQIEFLLPYREPLVQSLVTAAKFEASRRAQKLLGEILAEYLYKRYSARDPFAKARTYVIIPLPLGKKRLRERGYNQVTKVATFALQKLGPESGFTLNTKILLRPRETKPQTSLKRGDRLRNIQGALAVNLSLEAPLDPDTLYILLDDVLTTGATLLAAHSALQNALGDTAAAKPQIHLLAIAH
jgi:predicted amidophosphoribosyltransferase